MARMKYNILSLFLFFAILCLCSNCPAQPPCQKYALVIDGGDGGWLGRVIGKLLAKNADSVAEWLSSNGFSVTRVSQYWGGTETSIPDTGSGSMEKGLQDFISGYASSIKCPQGETEKKCCHELFIYICAHGTKVGFSIYSPLGTGEKDYVSYMELASWLRKLPPCVKLTIFIDACESGAAIDSGGAAIDDLRSLCDVHGQCGVTIMTTTDKDSSTPTGASIDSGTKDFMDGAGKDNDGDGDKGDIRDRWEEMKKQGGGKPQLFRCNYQDRMCSLENVPKKPLLQEAPRIPAGRIPPLTLGDGLESGALALAIDGTGTTTRMAITLTNKTSDSCTVVIPTGTPLEPGSKDHQPYQTGYIPPIELGPGETETIEVPAFCTDSEKEPAPKDGSVTYTLHEGPLTPEQEKVTEIIVVTNTLRQLHETCGKVAEPDDFIGPPPPPEKPEPEVYGPPVKPPKPEEVEEVLQRLQRVRQRHIIDDDWTSFEHSFMDILEWVVTFGSPPPPSAPKEWDEDEDFGGIPEPPPGPPEPAPPEGFEVPPGTIVLPPDVILLSLSGPLEFPGTTQFTLAEVPELRTNISSEDEKGEAVFSNPAGKVEVSLAPTEDPNIVKFDITKLEAHSPSFKALGKSRKDINIALNSPEKSTGTLNIKTGEVRGTVSVKAWGKKYKEPFPAAASYTGKFDFPTKKLSLSLSGTSFEPVDLEEGLYQRIKPEKFWDSVMLYSIWKETNDQGKEELARVMTEQLRADFPKERAEGLSALVAGEIVHRVDEVHERHKKLKKEEADFSILDPTLKLRKT